MLARLPPKPGPINLTAVVFTFMILTAIPPLEDQIYPSQEALAEMAKPLIGLKLDTSAICILCQTSGLASMPHGSPPADLLPVTRLPSKPCSNHSVDFNRACR